MIRRLYVDGRYGQVHLRENSRVGGVPLVCLHATAYSSRSFEALLRALDGRRHVIAVDTPGYGESDRPADPIAIAGYADAIAEVIAEVIPGSVDLFGYHTGVSIAAEIAIRAPTKVDRLIFLGVPHFRALDFDHWRRRLTERHALGDTLDQFRERWDFLVAQRPAGLSLRRGYENFVDELKAWPDGWWAHEALFDHDLVARLPLIAQPVTVLIAPGHLAEPSRKAAMLMPTAEAIELPDASGAVLDAHADRIARLCLTPEPIAS